MNTLTKEYTLLFNTITDAGGGPPPTEPDADGGPAAGRGVVFGGGTGGARRKRRIDTVTTAAKRGMLYILTFTTGGGLCCTSAVIYPLPRGFAPWDVRHWHWARTHSSFYPQSPGERAKALDAADADALTELLRENRFAPIIAHAPYNAESSAGAAGRKPAASPKRSRD